MGSEMCIRDRLTGTQVTLDGSASVDNDNGPQALTYSWQVLSVPTGSAVSSQSLVNQGTPNTSFTADVAGSYSIQLSVSDGELTDVVAVTVVINEIVINVSIPIMLRKFFLKVKTIRDKEIKQNP